MTRKLDEVIAAPPAAQQRGGGASAMELITLNDLRHAAQQTREHLADTLGDGQDTSAVREKFYSQASPDVLAALQAIAESQGRELQSVLDNALRDYIDRQQKDGPRRHVMASFAPSQHEFDELYRELAR